MVLQDLQKDFKGSNWKREIDVRDFIQANYEPYNGDESFLTGPSEKTKKLWSILSDLFEVEREKEFAPVKNATGVDSVESARALLVKNGIEI